MVDSRGKCYAVWKVPWFCGKHRSIAVRGFFKASFNCSIIKLADDVALAKGAWGMAEHIERLRTERPEKGQGRRNWDCAAQAVSRKAAEMRKECAASERRKDEAEAEERRRLENNPFAALAALKRGTK